MWIHHVCDSIKMLHYFVHTALLTYWHHRLMSGKKFMEIRESPWKRQFRLKFPRILTNLVWIWIYITHARYDVQEGISCNCMCMNRIPHSQFCFGIRWIVPELLSTTKAFEMMSMCLLRFYILPEFNWLNECTRELWNSIVCTFAQQIWLKMFDVWLRYFQLNNMYAKRFDLIEIFIFFS